MLSKLFSVLLFFLLLISCAKKEQIYTPTAKKDPFVIYQEGYEAFEKNDFFNASKKFSEAELNFEDVSLAAKSSIMNCFSLYSINFYEESLENLDRFIKTYPANKNIIYAEYLKAVIYFEQISDEKKDLKPLIAANKQIVYFTQKYPDSEYTTDLKFKKDLIQNQLVPKKFMLLNTILVFRNGYRQSTG